MKRMTQFAVAAMIATAALSHFLAPDERTGLQPLGLETVIPLQVGEWKMVSSSSRIDNVVVGKIYDSVLMREYGTPDGRMIWLTAAYGYNQRDELSIHLPEGCYAVQGFTVTDTRVDRVRTRAGEIEVKRLVARNSMRTEPITYWVRIGDRVVTSGVGGKLERLRYAISGRLTDGMLVRISQPADDIENSYREQDLFISTLLETVKPEQLKMLAGTSANPDWNSTNRQAESNGTR